MAERSSTPEPFDCKTPPNEIDETFPMLKPAVFTLDLQNVEEDLEVINEHNLNSATFWRGVCLQYHQTFLEIRAEVDEANILEEPLNAAKIEEKLLRLKPLQEIHIIMQPKIPKEKKSNERSTETLIEQMYQEYQQTDLAQELSQLTILPPPKKELMDMLQEITKITGHYSHIEKFAIRSAYVIRTWLEAAFTSLTRQRVIDLVEILKIG